MAYNYDRLYGEARDALGPPTRIFTDFFDRLERQDLRVLDVGCGQGRDALFIARLGHRVVAVDISPNGIGDLVAAASEASLAIEGVVADITAYRPEGVFDIILIDRTLHMLAREARRRVLAGLLDHADEMGWLLIADEASNIADFEAVLTAHERAWAITLRQRGYLFAQRD